MLKQPVGFYFSHVRFLELSKKKLWLFDSFAMTSSGHMTKILKNWKLSQR